MLIAIVSIGAVSYLLADVRASSPHYRVHLGLSLAAIVLSWMSLQVLFALFYARTYYETTVRVAAAALEEAVALTIHCGCRSLLGLDVTKDQSAPAILRSIDAVLLERFGGAAGCRRISSCAVTTAPPSRCDHDADGTRLRSGERSRSA